MLADHAKGGNSTKKFKKKTRVVAVGTGKRPNLG